MCLSPESEALSLSQNDTVFPLLHNAGLLIHVSLKSPKLAQLSDPNLSAGFPCVALGPCVVEGVVPCIEELARSLQYVSLTTPLTVVELRGK